MRIAVSPGFAVVPSIRGNKGPRLGSGYRRAFLLRACENRRELFALQTSASDQGSPDLGQREDFSCIDGLDGPAIEDAHVSPLDA